MCFPSSPAVVNLRRSIMADIDNLVDKTLANSRTMPRPAAAEPPYVLTKRCFKTWKLFKREFSNGDDAYHEFNNVMSQLSKLGNVVVDNSKSKVSMKDISPSTCDHVKLKYIVEVFWQSDNSN